jgi:MinD-like ATPase involved in chromosome partitioning or flagellar assembly
VDLPTYTNIWRIEKRLYKLYDFRLPMPLPVGQIAVFLAIAVPYVVVLTLFGLPFNHTLVWVYVLPPGLLAWLTTRPVLESKRLPELVRSQVRYLFESRTWCRMAPLAEKDEVIVFCRVWRQADPAADLVVEVADVEMPPDTAADGALPAGAHGQPRAGRGRRRATWPLGVPARPIPAQAAREQTAREQTVREQVARAGHVVAQAGYADAAGDRAAGDRAVGDRGVGDRGVGGRAAGRAGGGHAAGRHSATRSRVSRQFPATSGLRPASGLRPSSGLRLPPGMSRPDASVPPPAPPVIVGQVDSPAPWPAAQPTRVFAVGTPSAAADTPSPGIPSMSPPSASDSAFPAANPVFPAADPVSPAANSVSPAAGLVSPAVGDAAAARGDLPPASRGIEPSASRPQQSAHRSAPPAVPVVPAVPHAPPLADLDERAGPGGSALDAGHDGPDHEAAPPQVPAPQVPAPQAPSPPVARPVVTVTGDPTAERPLRVVERALRSQPGQRPDGWRDRVVVVPGGHRPGKPDQLQRDRARARLPVEGARRIVVLGCTRGAGQTMTALLAGDTLASLRGEPVAVLDLNPGRGSLTERAAAIPGLVQDQAAAGWPAAGGLRSASATADRRRDSGLQVISGGLAAEDRDNAGRILDLVAARYPLTLADPAAGCVPRTLAVADQLLIIAPASAAAASALAMTFEWLEAHGHGRLAASAVTVLNGVSGPTTGHVEHAAAVASGRCRAIVKVPWDDHLRTVSQAPAPPSPAPHAPSPSLLSPALTQAYTALAGVLIAGLTDPGELRSARA